MSNPITTIAIGIGEFILLSLLTVVPPLFVAIDAIIIGDGVSEISLTEFAQEILILASALLFVYGAWRHPASRGFFVLGSGVFFCMLIRELDGFLDQIYKGFWVWPGMVVITFSSFYAITFCRHKIVAPTSAFIDTKPYFHMVFGLIVVLVFSRIFGSGTLLLKHLNISDYNHVFKSAIQEGLELFGYLFITYGSFLLIRRKRTGVTTPEKTHVDD